MKNNKVFISIVLAIILIFCSYGCTGNNETVSYSVTFKVDGAVYDTVSVRYDETAVLTKENPTKEGWTFIGWDKPLTNIKEDTTVNAVWEKDEEDIEENDKIKITINNETRADFTDWADGSVGTKIFYLEEGEKLVIPAIIYDTYDDNRKNNEDYNFLGWYYKDKNNQEKEFDQSKELDLDSLNIDSNEIVIYAKVKRLSTVIY